MFLDENYVRRSLEVNAFFARIMKEHSLFLAAGFTPADKEFTRRALFFKNEFEKILLEAITLSNGRIGCGVLQSCELVTEFTGTAEMQTQKMTGIPINTEITEKTCRLECGGCVRPDSAAARRVMMLNRSALKCVRELIEFKEAVLQRVLCCEMFTANYPLLIDHILREARRYCEMLEALESGGDCRESEKDTEMFWNRIMKEHSLFMRGLLDPTECELIETANAFASDFGELLCKPDARTLTAESLAETMKLRDFKTSGVKGIEECKIKSIILPLLADHVLRESNHYIRILREM